MLGEDNFNELTISTSQNNNEMEKNLNKKRIKRNLFKSLNSSNLTYKKINILSAKTGISLAKFRKNGYLDIDLATSNRGLSSIYDNLAEKMEPIVIVFKEDNSTVNNEKETYRNKIILVYISFSFAFIIIIITFRCLLRASKKVSFEKKNSFKNNMLL